MWDGLPFAAVVEMGGCLPIGRLIMDISMEDETDGDEEILERQTKGVFLAMRKIT